MHNETHSLSTAKTMRDRIWVFLMSYKRIRKTKTQRATLWGVSAMQNAECASLKYWTDQRLLHFQDFSKKTKYYRTPCTALRTSAQPISFRGNKKKKGGVGGVERSRPPVTCRACRAVFSDWLGCMRHIWNSNCRERERREEQTRCDSFPTLHFSSTRPFSLKTSALPFVSWI